MRFDAVIFDIDGTLWDSCEGVQQSWQESLLRHYGSDDAPDLSQVRSIMGLGPDEIALKLFSRFGTRAREVFDTISEDECAWLAVHGADVYPGVLEGLRALAQTRRLFLVSNCQRGYLEAFLAANALEGLFEDGLSTGITGLAKPDNLKKMKREHALSRAVFVGDTRSDENAAREASCSFIHAAYGFGKTESPDAVLRSFAELPAVLETLEKEDETCPRR